MEGIRPAVRSTAVFVALTLPIGQYTHMTGVRADEFLFVAGMLSGDTAGNVIGEGEFDIQNA